MTGTATRAHWDTLLDAARNAHAAHAKLSGFCAFPDDLTPAQPAPNRIGAAGLMESDPVVRSCTHPLAQALLGGSPHAQWRETYKGTDIAQDFLDRFGCYCLIGTGGAFTSRQMGAFVVYMPPGLHYPCHQHPAEEMYYILAGEAGFTREGEAPETLGAGDVSFHASGQPHATATHDLPVLAYVLWRNHLGTPPVWTPGQGL